MAEDFLVAHDVSYRYAGRKGEASALVLSHFSLGLTQSEFFCLLGPSGCGKTTVLNLMAGFIAPATGSLSLAGQAIDGPGVDRTVVFQGDDALFNWLRTIDNVGFRPADARRARRRAAMRSRANICISCISMVRRTNIRVNSQAA